MWRQVFERCLGLKQGIRWSRIPSFEDGILKAVNDSFDRDTSGAVAGAVLGAYWGEGGIPERWKRGVEKGEEIASLTKRLIRSVTEKRRLERKESLALEGFGPKEGPTETTVWPPSLLVITSSKQMKCVHFTLIVRNVSLNELYPGGFTAFGRECFGRSNKDLTLAYYMGGDLDDCVQKLESLGLVRFRDFMVFDASSYALALTLGGTRRPRPHEVPLNVGWLKAHMLESAEIFVEFVPEPPISRD